MLCFEGYFFLVSNFRHQNTYYYLQKGSKRFCFFWCLISVTKSKEILDSICKNDAKREPIWFSSCSSSSSCFPQRLLGLQNHWFIDCIWHSRLLRLWTVADSSCSFAPFALDSTTKIILFTSPLFIFTGILETRVETPPPRTTTTPPQSLDCEGSKDSSCWSAGSHCRVYWFRSSTNNSLAVLFWEKETRVLVFQNTSLLWIQQLEIMSMLASTFSDVLIRNLASSHP